MYLQRFQPVWNEPPDQEKKISDIVYLTIIGCLLGMCAGAVIAVFRYAKDSAFDWMLNWTQVNRHSITVILLLFIILFLAALLVGWLIRTPAIRYGGASWIDNALEDGQGKPWLKILIPKFLGSWVVLACGISVGSEGPCIQMGAATALGTKKFDSKQTIERRYFILAGCAAGLSAAFSAPFAGICYVYEIMKQKMDRRLFMFLMSGAFGVYFSVTLIFRLDVLLPLHAVANTSLSFLLLLAPLGVFSGLIGIVYHFLLYSSIKIYTGPKALPVRVRPLLPFLAAGVMLLVYPAVSGEGMGIFAKMDTPDWVWSNLCIFLLIKLLFTAFCYGSGIPAGEMVPILAIGGVCGGIYGDWLIGLNLLTSDYIGAMIVFGMAGAFSAAERAPLTALVLVTGLSGCFNISLGVLFVAGIAFFCARLIKKDSHK